MVLIHRLNSLHAKESKLPENKTGNISDGLFRGILRNDIDYTAA